VTRLAEIQGRIASINELSNIVGAMRSLASMRVQEAQRALPGIRRYAEQMAAAIGSALLLLPQPIPDGRAEHGRHALILCAAEHGFVGSYNERLMEAAEALLKPPDLLFILGSRGAEIAIERGCKAVWSAPMASRLAGAPDAIDRLTTELYRRISRGEISRVEVMYGRYSQGLASTIERRLLLPLDTNALATAQTRQAPLHNLEPHALLEKLMAEYVFALLTGAAIESMASENAARFAAMEAAHDNVTKKLSQLRQSAGQARQAEITEELLDLITGAEANAQRAGSSRPKRNERPDGF
jgi:F-type H+-transporting ATPase subunit gamma